MSEKRQEISSKPKSNVSEERGSGELAKISANKAAVAASAAAEDKELKRKDKEHKRKSKKSKMKSAGPASTNRTKYLDGYNLLDRMKLDWRHKNFVKLDDYNVKGEFPNTCFLV